MLSKEDSRRLAQLERQLRRDDPEFCARMAASRPARRRIPLALVFLAVVIWTAALILGVLGWWIAAGAAALCATITVVVTAFRASPKRRSIDPGPLPPVW
jgi:hypothetical protein